MTRILLLLTIPVGVGATLAASAAAFDVSTGWIGAVGLIGYSVHARRRWRSDERELSEPGPWTQALWIRCAGFALLLGHLATGLALVGDSLRMGGGNSLAIDSWLMVAAAFSTELIFRRKRRVSDERDEAIAGKGVAAGYLTSVALTGLFALSLVLIPSSLRDALSHFVIANLLVEMILISYLAQLVVRLREYQKDAVAFALSGAG